MSTAITAGWTGGDIGLPVWVQVVLGVAFSALLLWLHLDERRRKAAARAAATTRRRRRRPGTRKPKVL